MQQDLEIIPGQPLDPVKFQQDLHQALRLCQKSGDHTNPLSYLALYKQSYAHRLHVRQAVNDVLCRGMKRLAADDKPSVDLLTLRFFDSEKVSVLSQRLYVSETEIYNRQRTAIRHLAEIILQLEGEVRAEIQSKLEQRLDLPLPVDLFGVDDHLVTLLEYVNTLQAPWLISIEGLGGIGKTALANALVRRLALTGCFIKEIAWVSAKQQPFLPLPSLHMPGQPALDKDSLLTALLEQLQPKAPLPASPQEKMAALIQLLKTDSYFIVIDNLETVADYEALLPTLNKLANPTQFLLTSRYSLNGYADVGCYALSELDRTDAIAFLRHEADIRRIRTLAQASQSQLAQIYQVVGGNPLALKLVVGQITHLSLPNVLAKLENVGNKKSEELYSYIYQEAWGILTEASKRTLLAMPFADNGDLDQILAVSELDEEEVTEGLEQLVSLSLVEVDGDLAELSYHIHQLTRTFLLAEVVPQWDKIG